MKPGQISTKEMLELVSSMDIDSSVAWDAEFSIDVIKNAKLLQLELQKLELILDDPKMIIPSINTMEQAEKLMNKMNCYFKSFYSKYSYLTKVKSLDQVPSTIADLDNVEEHDLETLPHTDPI